MARKQTDPRPDARRLTSEQAKEIRQRRANGEAYYRLASAYGVSQTTVFFICNGKDDKAAGKVRLTYQDPASLIENGISA